MTYSPHRRNRLSGVRGRPIGRYLRVFLRKLGRPFNSAGESHTYAELTGSK
jgi:hypothetical protein